MSSKLPRNMYTTVERCREHYHGDGAQCGYDATTYYSHGHPIMTICGVHGVTFQDTTDIGPETPDHRQWLAEQYPEYAKRINQPPSGAV